MKHEWTQGKRLIGIHWNKIETKKSKEHYFDEWAVKVIYTQAIDMIDLFN